MCTPVRAECQRAGVACVLAVERSYSTPTPTPTPTPIPLPLTPALNPALALTLALTLSLALTLPTQVVRLLEDPTAYPRPHHYHQRCPTARPQWHARSEVEAREARRREAREARGGEHAHACQCAPACSCTVS